MLKNKSAIVTGSTSGIGLGIARALAAQRLHVDALGVAARLRDGFADEAGRLLAHDDDRWSFGHGMLRSWWKDQFAPTGPGVLFDGSLSNPHRAQPGVVPLSLIHI